MGVRPTVQLVGRRMDAEHYRLRDFLTRAAQPYEWFEAGTSEADDLLAGSACGRATCWSSSTATDVYQRDGRVDRRRMGPRDAPAARPLRLRRHRRRPGGLAAAVYAASDGLKTVVFDRDVPGGQASYTAEHRELLRLPGRDRRRRAGPARRAPGRGIRGRADAPARDQGKPHRTARRARSSSIMDGGHEVTASVVLAATGMDWRRLDLEGVDELIGHGIYYGAGRQRGARSARGRTSSSSARATRPARRCSTSPTRTRA